MGDREYWEKHSDLNNEKEGRGAEDCTLEH